MNKYCETGTQFHTVRILTSTNFFFLDTLFFCSFSGWGAARLTGGLDQSQSAREKEREREREREGWRERETGRERESV